MNFQPTILGSGARFNKTRPNDEPNWRDRDHPGAWSQRPKGAKNDSRKGQKGKGWEHDDRFDNDYS